MALKNQSNKSELSYGYGSGTHFLNYVYEPSVCLSMMTNNFFSSRYIISCFSLNQGISLNFVLNYNVVYPKVYSTMLLIVVVKGER
jgi:hypothetical protein